MFYIPFRIFCDQKKKKTTCLLWSSKWKFSLLVPSSWHQQRVVVLCFYRVTKIRANQLTYFLWAIFLKVVNARDNLQWQSMSLYLSILTHALEQLKIIQRFSLKLYFIWLCFHEDLKCTILCTWYPVLTNCDIKRNVIGCPYFSFPHYICLLVTLVKRRRLTTHKIQNTQVLSGSPAKSGPVNFGSEKS